MIERLNGKAMSKQLAKMLMAGVGGIGNTDTLADQTSASSAFELQKTTIRLFKSDLEYLKENYPDNYNAQIRRIINHWVKANASSKERIDTNFNFKNIEEEIPKNSNLKTQSKKGK